MFLKKHGSCLQIWFPYLNSISILFLDDVIVSVNNTEVDMRNIDSVLSQVNGGHEVILQIFPFIYLKDDPYNDFF